MALHVWWQGHEHEKKFIGTYKFTWAVNEFWQRAHRAYKTHKTHVPRVSRMMSSLWQQTGQKKKGHSSADFWSLIKITGYRLCIKCILRWKEGSVSADTHQHTHARWLGQKYWLRGITFRFMPLFEGSCTVYLDGEALSCMNTVPSSQLSSAGLYNPMLNLVHFKTNTTLTVKCRCEDAPPLEGGLDPDAGTAHSYFYSHWLQIIFFPVPAELLLEEHSALQNGDGVVVEALHCDWFLLLAWAVLDEDASWTQALSLGVTGRKVILLRYKSASERMTMRVRQM